MRNVAKPGDKTIFALEHALDFYDLEIGGGEGKTGKWKWGTSILLGAQSVRAILERGN